MPIQNPIVIRSPKNPILTADNWPYPIHSVFNPGAVRLKDGTTLLLCRCEDYRGISHFTVARSANGIDGWEIEPKPTLMPEPDWYPEELWGIEDPRITYMEEEDRYLIAYTAFSRNGPGVAIACTDDFVDFDRHGLVMQPDDKDAAIFPKKFDGNYVLIHRPMTGFTGNMWTSRSPDLTNWGSHQVLLPARRGAWWDANKLGLCCPPIPSPEGWIVLYHGVRMTAAGGLYRMGVALLDNDRPEVCILRGQPWCFGPEAPYEMEGDVGHVVFPCGFTIQDDGDTVYIYYGAADTSIALAITKISTLLEWLHEFGSTMVGIAGQPTEQEHMVEQKTEH